MDDFWRAVEYGPQSWVISCELMKAIKRPPAEWLMEAQKRRNERGEFLPPSHLGELAFEAAVGRLILEKKTNWRTGDELEFHIGRHPVFHAVAAEFEPFAQSGRVGKNEPRYGFIVRWSPESARKIKL